MSERTKLALQQQSLLFVYLLVKGFSKILWRRFVVYMQYKAHKARSKRQERQV